MKVNMDIIYTLKDNGNLMDGCIIVVEDLTEEKKLEYEAPFKLIKENNYGILFTDCEIRGGCNVVEGVTQGHLIL